MYTNCTYIYLYRLNLIVITTKRFLDKISGLNSLFILQTKVCDFYEDCEDFSDEATCPTFFMFDDCKDNWGDKMCYWQEDPVDELDWIIAHGKFNK